MAKQEKIFTLNELWETAQFIQENQGAVNKALEEGTLEKLDHPELAAKLEQLALFFGFFDAGLGRKEIVGQINLVLPRLAKIIQTKEAYPEETFTASFVPKQLVDYWKVKAAEKAKDEAAIDKLVNQRVTAWIVGLQEKFAHQRPDLFPEGPEGEVPKETAEPFLDYLSKQKKVAKKRLFAGEVRIRRALAPLREDLAKLIDQEEAEEITEKLSLMPAIKSEEGFQKKLKELLTPLVVAEEVEGITEALAQKHYPALTQALNLRGQQTELLGQESDLVSATNLAPEGLPENIKSQLRAEPGKTREETALSLGDWWRAQGYPLQTLLSLAQADPRIFRGTFQEVKGNIREAFLPGFPLRSQFLWILSAGRGELTALRQSALVGGWEAIYGKEEAIPVDIIKRFEELLEKAEEDRLPPGVDFEQREKFLVQAGLLKQVKKMEKFQKAHPFLAGGLRAMGRIFAFPVRHQKIFMAYQAAKLGPYAPRVFMEFYAREVVKTIFKAGMVRLTKGQWWGWTTKRVPFIGHKVVWKPTHKLKLWAREKLFKAFKGLLTKLGLEKLVLALAGGGIVGGLILTFKEPIKKTLMALGALLLTILHWAATYGLAALISGIAGTLGGFAGGVYLGWKVGGVLGLLAGGPVGAVVGGVIGALVGVGLVKLWQGIVGGWHSLTAAGVAGISGLSAGITGFISQITAGLSSAAAPILGLSGGIIIGSSLLLNQITSSAFPGPLPSEGLGEPVTIGQPVEPRSPEEIGITGEELEEKITEEEEAGEEKPAENAPFLAELLLNELINKCGITQVNQETWEKTKECFQESDLPGKETIIDQFEYSVKDVGPGLQCVGFVRAVMAALGRDPGGGRNARDYLNPPTPSGYLPANTNIDQVQVGDIVIMRGEKFGHMGIVIDREGDTITVAQAFGSDGGEGVVRITEVNLSAFDGFLRSK